MTYHVWVKRFILFHHVHHAAERADPKINAFLTHLAVKERVSASTQNQALSALLFLYRHVIRREIGDLGEVVRARRPKRLPVVLTRDEARAISLTYGGPRLICTVVPKMEDEWQRSTMFQFVGKAVGKQKAGVWVTTPLGYAIADKFSLAHTRIFIRLILVRSVV